MTDVAAAYGLAGRPFWVVVAVLFAIVFARSHGTYWLGRGVTRGARAVGQLGHDEADASSDATHAPGWWQRATARSAVWSTTPAARRGTRLVHRYGPFAVTAAYLTFGIQTAVFAGAGLVRMPYLRFTIASIPGALAWAFVWATVGLGAVWGAVALAARSPWALVVVLVALTGVVLWWVRRRASRRLPLDQVPSGSVGALTD